MNTLNDTHNPTHTSWVASANTPNCDFPIQNLPFAVFKRAGSQEAWRGGVAIGDQVLDLSAACDAGVFTGLAAQALAAASQTTLNAFMAMGQPAWSALRLALSQALRTGSPHAAQLLGCLVPQGDVVYTMPAHVRDYTDFYTSIHHATSVGKMFRPDAPLLPNYQWVPIGYHGRASSIQAAGGLSEHAPQGQQVRRPHGQLKPPHLDVPSLGACKRLDYELELGIFVGTGNTLGEPIAIDAANDHVFGMVLLNDWSARDMQAWEYQPLGPFLAKNFATTISPWVVTMEALAPYRTTFTRPAADPQPLPYLSSEANSRAGALNITVEAYLQTPAMQAAAQPAHRLSSTTYDQAAYWTVAQLITHHTVNGCNLATGDLLGTGTLSGPAASEAGSLLELSNGGKAPLTLPNGEVRSFLENGDTLVLNAYCQAAGKARIGFGQCVGTVVG